MSNLAFAPSPEEAIVSLGQMIKKARVRKGYTQARLSELSEIHVNSISKYEKAGEPGGQYPPADKLVKLSSLLSLDPRSLFAEVSEDAGESFPAPEELRPEETAQRHLAEAARLMGGTIVFEAGQKAAADIEGQSDPETDELGALGELSVYIEEKGIHGRGIAQKIDAAEGMLSALERDELAQLALDRGLDVSECLPADPDAEVSQDDDHKICQSIEGQLILSALYASSVDDITTPGLDRAKEELNKLYAENDMFFVEGIIEGEGFFENREKYRQRLLLALPEYLIRAAKDRQGLPLDDQELYPQNSE